MRNSTAVARPREELHSERPGQRSAPHRLAALFVPLDRLLTSGGDTRLDAPGPSRRNAYGAGPCPSPQTLAFASSTASAISEQAYARADEARHELIAQALFTGIEDAFDARLEAMRCELKAHLGLGAGEIVFSPSGTDAQLQALFAARAILKKPLTVIVVAADETGSGTRFTAQGQHFSERTALARPVVKGSEVTGLSGDLITLPIALKDERGVPYDPTLLDATIEQAVADAIARGRRVLLQAMDSSKFGSRAPSQDCLARIAARWPDDVQVVVDACQARLGRQRIRAYLGRGAIVLLTGSKFFTGPAFSGAMLVPARHAAAIARATFPPGLTHYSTRSDWPLAWPKLRAQLAPHMNFGMWLRWEAALHEIRRYHDVPLAARREILEEFSEAVSHRIAAAPSLQLIAPQQSDFSSTVDDEEFTARTIFPFLIRSDGEYLSPRACSVLYQALNRDVSSDLPAHANAGDRATASRFCHIGQPVSLAVENGMPTAALRIAASARLVSECWSTDGKTMRARLNAQIANVSLVLQKIELLLTHLPDLAKGTP